jgi:hypothetical protein
VFSKFSGRHNKSWEKEKFMSKEEFTMLLQIYGIATDFRYIERSFHMSLMTWVDELHSTRYMQMEFVEFLEGFARIADKAYITNEATNHEITEVIMENILQILNAKQEG